MDQPLHLLHFIFMIAFIRENNAEGSCSPSFQRYLDCMKPSVYERVTKFAEEVKAEVQKEVERCFESFGCSMHSAKDASIHAIVNQPKAADIIKAVLELLENSPKDVQVCTINFLVGSAGRKVEKCIKTVNIGGSARFKMPKLPEFDILTISSMKKSVINRIAVSQQMSNCSSKLSRSELESLILCVQKARHDTTEKVCSTQETCINKRIARKCVQSFQSIKSASCSCLEKEQRLNIETDIEGTRDLLNLFVKGRLLDEFKICSQNYGFTVPEDQITQANRAISAFSREQIRNKTPISRGLLQLSAQLLGLMTQEILTAWCADCSLGAQKRTVEAEMIDLKDPSQAKSDQRNKGVTVFDAVGGGMQSLWSIFG